MLYGRINGLPEGPKRAIYRLRSAGNGAEELQAGNSAYIGQKCVGPLKVEGKEKIDFDFLALQAKPHKMLFKKKKQVKKKAESLKKKHSRRASFSNWRKFEEREEEPLKKQFQHGLYIFYLLSHQLFSHMLSFNYSTMYNSYDAMSMEILCNKDPMMYLPQEESL